MFLNIFLKSFLKSFFSRELVSFFLISGLTANRWSNHSGDILKYLRGKKGKTEWLVFNHIFFHLESGDLERLFGTKKMGIPKMQKLQPCKFNKHLFFKKLRSSMREIFFEKLLLEFRKCYRAGINVFRSIHRRCSIKNLFLKIHNINRKTSVLESLFNKVAMHATLLKRDSNTGVLLWILRNF